MARQTLVRDAESLAKVMAVDGAKHGVRGGKSLPATGLAPILVLVKRPRSKRYTGTMESAHTWNTTE